MGAMVIGLARCARCTGARVRSPRCRAPRALDSLIVAPRPRAGGVNAAADDVLQRLGRSARDSQPILPRQRPGDDAPSAAAAARKFGEFSAIRADSWWNAAKSGCNYRRNITPCCRLFVRRVRAPALRAPRGGRAIRMPPDAESSWSSSSSSSSRIPLLCSIPSSLAACMKAFLLSRRHRRMCPPIQVAPSHPSLQPCFP